MVQLQAPPGPIFMTEYHNAKHDRFVGLNNKAAEVADQGTKSGEDGRQLRAHHGSAGYRAFDYRHWTTLSFQGRADRFYDSCLPVALPASVAIAFAAPHLTGTVSVAYLISAKGAVSC